MIKLNLKEIMEAKDISRYNLVQELHSSYPVINKLVDGEAAYIKFETLDKLLNYLDCTLEELITYEKN